MGMKFGPSTHLIFGEQAIVGVDSSLLNVIDAIDTEAEKGGNDEFGRLKLCV